MSGQQEGSSLKGARGPQPSFVTSYRTKRQIYENPEELATMPFPVNTVNQNWAIISFVGPETAPRSKDWALRIYGTYASLSEAEADCKKALEAGYDLFDLDIVDISHGFFPIPPPSDREVGAVDYGNDRLNEIMGEHKQTMLDRDERVAARAEAEVDTRSPVEVFESMVTENALRLFKEWKAAGRVNTAKTIKQKLEKRFKEGIDKVTREVHGGETVAPLSAAESREAHKEAIKNGLITAPTALPDGAVSQDVSAARHSVRLADPSEHPSINDPNAIVMAPIRCVPRGDFASAEELAASLAGQPPGAVTAAEEEKKE